ncbi:MAG: hypothetical protein ACUVSC_05205 [Candidatus Fervidibacter sp.]|uniref:hypothetical protein n=1 Tax=Candidatus Fervidibacter sp. TaxID=3100871 RepID=UPI00404AF469
MLKRTMILLSLTITVGALLLVVGCGGSNSNPVASVSSESSDQPSRSWGDANVELRTSSTATVIVTDPDGIISITVRGSKGSRAYYFPKGKKEFEFQLSNFGQEDWYVLGICDGGYRVDSVWMIYKDGRVVRWAPR